MIGGKFDPMTTCYFRTPYCTVICLVVYNNPTLSFDVAATIGAEGAAVEPLVRESAVPKLKPNWLVLSQFLIFLIFVYYYIYFLLHALRSKYLDFYN